MRVCGWYAPRTNGHFHAQILILKGKRKEGRLKVVFRRPFARVVGVFSLLHGWLGCSAFCTGGWGVRPFARVVGAFGLLHGWLGRSAFCTGGWGVSILKPSPRQAPLKVGDDRQGHQVGGLYVVNQEIGGHKRHARRCALAAHKLP